MLLQSFRFRLLQVNLSKLCKAQHAVNRALPPQHAGGFVLCHVLATVLVVAVGPGLTQPGDHFQLETRIYPLADLNELLFSARLLWLLQHI